MTGKPKPDTARDATPNSAASKPDTATLMAMFAEDQDRPVDKARRLPPAAELSAVASDAWRSAQPKSKQPMQKDNSPGPSERVAEEPESGAPTPAGSQPSWMRIKADEQRFTSVRFSPELTEVLRHLAFLTRQSKTSLLNEALIDLVAKYRKAGVALPELTPDGTLKA
jgi:hypothetical protein